MSKQYASMFDYLNDAVAQLRKKLADDIRKIPDNPKIRRMGPNCFVISSSNLGTDWTPWFHDWPAQAAWLADVIEKHSEDPVAVLRQIARDGTFRKGDETKRFAPEVCKHVADLI